jgi:CheY-like chemotaxis protein
MLTTIFLVDERISSDGIRLLLNDAGYRVHTASNLAEAREEFGNKFNLAIVEPNVLCKIQDPEYAQVVQKLMSDARSRMPLWALTGYSIEALNENYGLLQGVHYDKHLEKPLDPECLFPMIREFLSRK